MRLAVLNIAFPEENNEVMWRYVKSCKICACSKIPHRPPSGLLQPLPMPPRPWSYIGMDFITSLAVSAWNTVILTVVDRFSKFIHTVALPKLP